MTNNYSYANLDDNDGYAAEIYTLHSDICGWRYCENMTLKELSNLTGLSTSFLSALEHGRAKPSLDTLQKLANAYQRTITIDIGFELK